LDKARAALEHAFSLARFKEEFHIWSMAASSVVDIPVLLAAMEMAWNREDHLNSDLGLLHKTRNRAEKKLRDQVCWETFIKAYACHHSSSSPLSTIFPTLSVTVKATSPLIPLVSSSAPKAVSKATQLAPKLPAHHFSPTIIKAGPQKLPPHHPKAVSTTSPNTKEMPNHPKQKIQTPKSSSFHTPTPISSPSIPSSDVLAWLGLKAVALAWPEAALALSNLRPGHGQQLWPGSG
jgi:hypothetical protein